MQVKTYEFWAIIQIIRASELMTKKTIEGALKKCLKMN